MNLNLILAISLGLGLLACSNNDDKNSLDWGANGVKIEKGKVIAYFPKDSVLEERMLELVDSLNLGIDAAMSYIGGPYEWQMFGNKPITYYFETGYFISNVDVIGNVHIPVTRVNDYKTPWMHETSHVLLRSKKGNWNELPKIKRYFSMPIWFTEGIAEYLAVKIEAVDSIKKFDVMKFGGYKNVDLSCYKSLKQNSGMVTSIGQSGIPTQLLINRKDFAPPFYTCSCSFIKYLAETYGLDKILKADAEFENEIETIELLTGKEISTLKKEWITNITPNHQN